MKLFLFTIAMAFDLLFLGALLSVYREALAARRWLRTTGRILSSRIETRRVQRSTDDADTRTPTYDLRKFAAVTYAFETPKGARRGSRISISGEIGESQAAATVERYPANARVEVFYDPADPGRCVLERDVIAPAFKTLFLIGVGFAIAACLFVVS